MSDLISRESVIDALHTWFRDGFDEDRWWNSTHVLAAIEGLPSAQPEIRVFGNMSDAEFEKWLYEHGICHPDIHESIPCDAVPLLIDCAISELPSAQPQHMKGKWIHDGYDFPHGNDWIHCSICGKKGINVPADLTNFCPNCGADMRGEELDETD